ncbi:MAG: hypothetical protein ACM3Q4_03565 [Acidobacteriota bacterium]
MIRRFGHTLQRCTAACCLAVLIFSFLHSELGQFSSQDDTHETHDFCMLVVDTPMHSQHSRTLSAASLSPVTFFAMPASDIEGAAGMSFGMRLPKRFERSAFLPSGVELHIYMRVFLI